jgi:hypothetical protein
VQLPVRGSDDRALAARPGRTAYAALLPRTATAHLPDNSSVLSRARAPAAVHRWVTHASSALPVLVPRPDACRRPGPGAMAQKSAEPQTLPPGCQAHTGILPHPQFFETHGNKHT